MLRMSFNPAWITSDKLDVKALYRRPAYDGRGLRRVDAEGRPEWDITSALPVRRHNDWAAKGFEFLALATWEDVLACRGSLETAGIRVQDLADSYSTIGEPNRRGFLVSAYLAELAKDSTAAYGRLAELVKEHGSEAVLAIMQATHPGYALPEALRGIPAPIAPDAPEPMAVGAKRRGRPKKVEEEIPA